MSIRELATGDAGSVAGGFIYRLDQDFGQTIYIDIAGPQISALICIPTPFVEIINDLVAVNPNGWTCAFIDLGNDMYVTGFSMNDSYGGEPSI